MLVDVSYKRRVYLTNALRVLQMPYVSYKRPTYLTNALHVLQTPYVSYKRPTYLTNALRILNQVSQQVLDMNLAKNH